MERKILPYIIVFSALSVSSSAIFYSVTGLGKMFAGASMQVMVMATALEIAKLVTAALLYNYWDEIVWWLKGYLVAATFALMVITSGGIYGYLSAAYAETKNKVELLDKNFAVMDTKKEMFNDKLASYQTEKESLNKNISELTKALSNNVIQYKDQETGQLITTTSSKNRKLYTERLNKSEERRDLLSENITAMTDSISKIDLAKIQMESESEIAGEIGPLKFIAELFGKSMDQVVNWFIIAIMAVFDPLAVALVIGANVVFAARRKEQDKEKKVNSIDGKLKEFEEREKEFKETEADFEKRLGEVSNKESDILERENKFKSTIEERERQLNSKLSEQELKAKKEVEEKLKTVDVEISKRQEEISKMEEEIKSSNEEISKTLKEEKARVQDIEYQLTEDRAKLKEEKDKFGNRIKNLDHETEKIETERKEIDKELAKIEEEKEKLSNERASMENVRREIDEWKRINWRVRKKNGNQ
jgi:chromosome segregation ATPase